MAKKKLYRDRDFAKAADKIHRDAKRKHKERDSGGGKQEPLPGVPSNGPNGPEGPLQFRVGSDRGKCSDKGKSMGRNREILVVLSRPFAARHFEVAQLLDRAVKVKALEGDREEACRLVRYAGSVGKDGVSLKATISTGADGHKWLGRMVTVETMEPALPLEEKPKAEAA